MFFHYSLFTIPFLSNASDLMPHASKADLIPNMAVFLSDTKKYLQITFYNPHRFFHALFFRHVNLDGVNVLLGFCNNVAFLQILIQVHLDFHAVARNATDGTHRKLLL